MLAKYLIKTFLQKTVLLKGLITLVLICTVQVQARTVIFLELDIVWQELYYGGEVPDANWGGMNQQQDVWQVVVEFEAFSLQSVQAIFERSHPTRPPFSTKVYSTSRLPVGVYPAVGHSALYSDDVVAKQTYSQDIERYGVAVLDDYLRGVAKSGSESAWYFRRRIAGVLAASATPNGTELANALNLVGRELVVSEEFSQRPVGSHLKYGQAVIRDVQVLNLDANASLRCRYALESDWGSGFTANIFLKNEGVEPISSWAFNIKFIDDVEISHSWSGRVFSETAEAHIHNLSWNNMIEPGQEISLGVNGVKTPSQSADAILDSMLCK